MSVEACERALAAWMPSPLPDVTTVSPSPPPAPSGSDGMGINRDVYTAVLFSCVFLTCSLLCGTLTLFYMRVRRDVAQLHRFSSSMFPKSLSDTDSDDVV